MQTKTLLIGLTLLFFASALFAQQVPGLTKNDQMLTVRFSKGMTKKDLDKVRSWADEQGIDITYERLEFNDDGSLRGIAFKVSTEEGYSGREQAFPLKDGKPIGFYRNYSKGTGDPFGTGTMFEQAEPVMQRHSGQ